MTWENPMTKGHVNNKILSFREKLNALSETCQGMMQMSTVQPSGQKKSDEVYVIKLE